MMCTMFNQPGVVRHSCVNMQTCFHVILGLQLKVIAGLTSLRVSDLAE